MKGYQVNAYAMGREVKSMKTGDYATAVGIAGIWSQKVDFVENDKIVQTMPEAIQLIDMDADHAVTKQGGERW
jgi:hypothetical protein